MGAKRGLIVLLLWAGGCVVAYGQAETHLSNGYPEVSCGDKPTRPERPAAFTDNEQIDAYNQMVEQYNQQMETYIDCVQVYVDKATRDLKLIKQRIQEAIDQANR